MFSLFDTSKIHDQEMQVKDIPKFLPGTACIPVTLVKLSAEDVFLNQALLAHRCFQYDADKIRSQIDSGTAFANNESCCHIAEGIQAFKQTLRDQKENLINNPHRAYHLLFDIAHSGDIVQLELLVKLFSLPVNLYDTSSKQQLQCVVPDTIMHAKIRQLFDEQQTETKEIKQAYRTVLDF